MMVTGQTAIIVFIMARCGILEFEAKRSRLVSGGWNKRGQTLTIGEGSHAGLDQIDKVCSLPSSQLDSEYSHLTARFLRHSPSHGYL